VAEAAAEAAEAAAAEVAEATVAEAAAPEVAEATVETAAEVAEAAGRGQAERARFGGRAGRNGDAGPEDERRDCGDRGLRQICTHDCLQFDLVIGEPIATPATTEADSTPPKGESQQPLT
jgi:hypothetical protein